jgi:hypothetical protein
MGPACPFRGADSSLMAAAIGLRDGAQRPPAHSRRPVASPCPYRNGRAGSAPTHAGLQAARLTIFVTVLADCAAEFVLCPAGQPSRTGTSSWRSSRRPAGARWSAATSCAKRKMRRSERAPKRFSVPPMPAGRSPVSREPEPLRLPPVEYGLNNIRCDAGERQEPADIGVHAALLLCEIRNRSCLPALDPPTPPMRAHERLDQRLVAARLRRQ